MINALFLIAFSLTFMFSIQVDKEDNAILHWVSHQTSIPSIISDQRNGKLLHVDGFGDYTWEWYMASDIKTLKCMYNIAIGLTISSPCIYCIEKKGEGESKSSCTQDERLNLLLLYHN